MKVYAFLPLVALVGCQSTSNHETLHYEAATGARYTELTSCSFAKGAEANAVCWQEDATGNLVLYWRAQPEDKQVSPIYWDTVAPYIVTQAIINPADPLTPAQIKTRFAGDGPHYDNFVYKPVNGSLCGARGSAVKAPGALVGYRVILSCNDVASGESAIIGSIVDTQKKLTALDDLQMIR